MPEDRNSVIKSIVALLSSAKATRLADINRDYQNVVGERIPFKSFGFNTLEDFFHSIPEFVITRKQNDYYVETRGASKSAHINELVAEQKSNSSRKSKSSRGRFRMTPSRPMRFSNRNVPPPVRRPVNNSQPARNAPSTSFSSHHQSSTMKNGGAPTVDYNKNVSYAPPKPFPAPPIKSFDPPPVQSAWYQPPKETSPGPSSVLPAVPPINLSRALEITLPKAEPKSVPPKQLTSPLSARLVPSHDKISSQPKKKSKASAVVSISLEELQGFDPSSPVSRLMDLLEKRCCRPPEFDILIQKNWTHNALKPFLCTVVIHWINDDERNKLEPLSCCRFSTYPKQFFDRDDALNAVSEIALEELMTKKQFLPQTSFPTVVLSRISEIVAGKEHGVWVHSLKEFYETAHMESLPSDWLDLVNDSNNFIVENLLENYWVIKPAIVAKTETMQLSPPLTPNSVPPIVLPESDTWDVFVVSIHPFNSVTLRIIGDEYSDAFVQLTTEMDAFYYANPSDHIPNIITLGRYYACRDVAGEDGAEWSRVRVTHVDEISAVVQFIDHGDTNSVDVGSLRELPSQFSQLPSQAVKFTLDGLEGFDYIGYEEHFELYENLAKSVVGLSCVAIIKNRDSSVVELHDTSGDKDINLNEEIKDKLLNLLQTRPLDQDGLIKAYIVKVEDDGAIFLQLPSFALSFLEEKLRRVDENRYDNIIAVKDPREVALSKVYFFMDDGFQCRAKVIDVDVNLGTVDVELMDIGGTKTLEVNQLILIPELQSVLRHIPAQARQVVLHDVRPAKSSLIAQFFREKAPCPVAGLVKVVNMNDGPLPEVSLYVQVGKQNVRISVSESLRTYVPNQLNLIEEVDEIDHIDDDKFDKVTNKNIPDQETLLPPTDELFPIYLTDFVNPHQFTVFPEKHVAALNEMTKCITEYYNSTPPHDINLPSEHLCAVFDPNYNFWFRARIMKYVDNQCCARLLDYGNVLITHTYNVRPLVDRFKQLPPIAFSATIHGIAPLDKDWDAKDCVEFSKQVSNKKYISMIKKVWTDNHTGGTKLSLVIIDTTTEEDVNLADILVNAGIGRFSD